MSALAHDSPDRVVTAIEPLTGSDNFATWKRLMTSYLYSMWSITTHVLAFHGSFRSTQQQIYHCEMSTYCSCMERRTVSSVQRTIIDGLFVKK
ncbi:uncharacterized protein N7518_004985 [Penicillium psychrosexuale]|uniref:uncharacterized protein n=1 Tax=Penicillium psychrosexuale TaxID=1002107 RepID=UPI002544F4FD|nr:uncharacterized protein N7518_004985 [Penicillium psychrosexuale]KAJ5796445.1 hypothetical protein N7518_004985 [Penicillium psychrosexuale]